jgi:hypothetical protein
MSLLWSRYTRETREVMESLFSTAIALKGTHEWHRRTGYPPNTPYRNPGTRAWVVAGQIISEHPTTIDSTFDLALNWKRLGSIISDRRQQTNKFGPVSELTGVVLLERRAHEYFWRYRCEEEGVLCVEVGDSLNFIILCSV